MSIVSNIISLRFHPVKGTQHKTDGVKPGLDAIRKWKKANAPAGEKKNMRKDDSADASRCSIGPIIMAAMNQQRQKAASNDASKVDRQKIPSPQKPLNRAAKQVEADHIEYQMAPVSMQQCGGEHAIIFPACQYALRSENVFLLESSINKSAIRKDSCKNDD